MISRHSSSRALAAGYTKHTKLREKTAYSCMDGKTHYSHDVAPKALSDLRGFSVILSLAVRNRF